MQWESLLMKKHYSFHKDIINIYAGHSSLSLMSHGRNCWGVGLFKFGDQESNTVCNHS